MTQHSTAARRALLRAPPRRSSPLFMLAPSGARLAPVLATPADVRRRAAADDCLAGSPETLSKPYTTLDDPYGLSNGRSRSMPASPLAAAAAAAAFGGQGFRAARLGFPLGSPTTEWLRDAAAAAEQGLRGPPQGAPASGQNPAPMPWSTAPPHPAGAPGMEQLSGGGDGAAEGSVREAGDAKGGGGRGHADGRGGEHAGKLREGAPAHMQASETGALPAARGTAALRSPDEPAGSRTGGAASFASAHSTASAGAACRGAPGGIAAHTAAADAAAPPRPDPGPKPFENPGIGARTRMRAGEGGRAGLGAGAGPGPKPSGNLGTGARARARASEDEGGGLRPGPVFVPIVLCMDEGDHGLLVREWYERRRQANCTQDAAAHADARADPAEALARLQALQVQAPLRCTPHGPACLVVESHLFQELPRLRQFRHMLHKHVVRTGTDLVFEQAFWSGSTVAGCL